MAELDYVQVGGRFGIVVGDTSNDPDEMPDMIPCDSGDITITPTLTTIAATDAGGDPITLGVSQIPCTVDSTGRLTYNDEVSVWLVDLGSDKINPHVDTAKADYKVSFKNMKAGSLSVEIPGFSFHPMPGQFNDLTRLVPLPTGSGSAVVVGPEGPVGPQGDPGEGVAAGGSQGQVLAKASGDDYDTEWADVSGGGGGGSSTLAALTDVDTTSQDIGDVLAYDGTGYGFVAAQSGPQGEQGEQGPTGPTGADGADGESAYELASDGGYGGTQTQW
ncbi:MAG: hypothetical protein ACRDP4_12755, partial [Nocardioidaceae bacterium]